MSRKQRHIKTQSTTTYEEPYANIERPTNATFIPTETMETNEEKKSVRQASETLYVKSKLVKNQKTKRSKEKKSTCKIMEGKTISLFATQIQ